MHRGGKFLLGCGVGHASTDPGGYTDHRFPDVVATALRRRARYRATLQQTEAATQQIGKKRAPIVYENGIRTISPWYGQSSGVSHRPARTGFIRT
jgi:hypothetical protein